MQHLEPTTAATHHPTAAIPSSPGRPQARPEQRKRSSSWLWQHPSIRASSSPALPTFLHHHHHHDPSPAKSSSSTAPPRPPDARPGSVSEAMPSTKTTPARPHGPGPTTTKNARLWANTLPKHAEFLAPARLTAVAGSSGGGGKNMLGLSELNLVSNEHNPIISGVCILLPPSWTSFAQHARPEQWYKAINALSPALPRKSNSELMPKHHRLFHEGR